MNIAYRVWDGEQMYYSDDDELTMIVEPSGAWEVKRYGMRGETIAHSHDGDIYHKDITEESVIDRYVIERKNGFDKMQHINGKDYRHLWLRIDEVKVIGNVFENPELLEGAE
ncbi:YopX family protein [Bacillus atrophaeus]|uniref:YopX family protein n=1 Tax=Bacillus atrophaeus TaxID=1452 RepID=UPI0022811026|nr:YopX family protein [Bacillus atrophaeus]MCY8958211.1 YopX family protein [Bacillus atrophaeus]MCY8963784.1 YopX family protein [Bacillus atrophaeus]MCY9161154.1 YopX family protein [Bacillus atrophaeus]MCY9440196.1 YopX family protein [Bacillus atrophaeus]MEC0648476.1 YopX family protein [Bacillus atrophaeus]